MRTIVLVGGDEFRPSCIAMDEQLLQLTPHQAPRVLIVPTAAAHERPELAVQNGIQHFAALGGVTKGLMALDRAAWENGGADRALDESDIVYFTGGDPWYLFQSIRETSLLTAILKRCDDGAILVGSSAGAMVLGGWLRKRPGGWEPGLGVLPDIAVIPHYRSAKGLDSLALRAGLPEGVSLLGIGEATGCVSRQDGHWTVLGQQSVRVIGPTALPEYRDHQSFDLP